MATARNLAATILLLGLATDASVAAEGDATARYFAGLRQRGLFDLAESEALRRLARDDVPRAAPDGRAAVAAELALTFAEHAKYLGGEEQADLWRRAERAIDEALARRPPNRLTLAVVRAELDLTRGETLRWRAELVPAGPQPRGLAEAALTQAVARLTAADTAIAREAKRPPRTETLPGEPDAAELADLRTRVRLALGRAELERARLMPRERRAAAVSAAERWLELVARGPDAAEPTWRAKVLRAEAARLEGEGDTARRRLAEPDFATLPDAAKDAAAVVSAELLLDERQPARAAEFLVEYRRARGTLDGPLQLLLIQSLAASATVVERLGNAAEAQALRDQAAVAARRTTAELGGYWGDRARLLAARAERAGRLGGDVAAQAAAADAALAAGDLDAALAAYAEAVRLAGDKPDVAAPLAYARGGLLLRAERFEEAAAALRAVAADFPDFDRAADADLLSVYALGRLYDAVPSAPRREAYETQLEAHRARFPESPTVAQATLRLARLHERRRQHSRAIPLLKTLLDDAVPGAAARAALARNYDELLSFLVAERRTAATPALAAARDAQIAHWSAAAAADLAPLAAAVAAQPEPLTAPQAELALRAARVFLRFPSAEGASAAPSAAALLDAVASAASVERPAEGTAFWEALRRSVRPLRIVSLAARGRTAEAAESIEGLADAAPAELLGVVVGLAELPPSSEPEPLTAPRRADLAKQAADLIEPRQGGLTAADARRLDESLARLDLAGGEPAAAVARLEAALSGRPNDAALLDQTAKALLAVGDAKAAARAREHLRKLEAARRPGSAGWFDARRRLIAATLAAGDPAEAKKLLAVTKLLHPALGGDESRAAFDRLERLVSGGTGPRP